MSRHDEIIRALEAWEPPFPATRPNRDVRSIEVIGAGVEYRIAVAFRGRVTQASAVASYPDRGVKQVLEDIEASVRILMNATLIGQSSRGLATRVKWDEPGRKAARDDGKVMVAIAGDDGASTWEYTGLLEPEQVETLKRIARAMSEGNSLEGAIRHVLGPPVRHDSP